MCLWVGWWWNGSKIEFWVGSVFLSFALECSHFPKNSILSAKRQFSARFSNCSNSLNFEAKINCNTTKQNDLKWRKKCTVSKFDLVHFNGPQTKFIVVSLYKHPVDNHWSPISSSDLSPSPVLDWQSDIFRGQPRVVCEHILMAMCAAAIMIE